MKHKDIWVCRLQIFRGSRSEVFGKNGALRNFANFTGKHLCQSLKVAGLRSATLLKKRRGYFPVNFAKILRTSFLTEHLRTTASGSYGTRKELQNRCS